MGRAISPTGAERMDQTTIGERATPLKGVEPDESYAEEEPGPPINKASDSSSSEVDSEVDLCALEDVFDFCAYPSDKEEEGKPSSNTVTGPYEEEKEEGELSSEEEEEVPPVGATASKPGLKSPTAPFLPLNLEGKSISWTRSYLAVDQFNKQGSCPAFELPDLARPPPAIPNFYGSDLFPQVEFYGSCPSQIFTQISRNYLAKECEAYKATRSLKPFYNLHNSRRGGKIFCNTCSELKDDPQKIWHRHESSKMTRLQSALDSRGRYKCDQCKYQLHLCIPGGRTSLLITSSTLNDFWGRKAGVPYVGDDLHLDVISLPGGRLHNLERAFRAEYTNHPLPIDCLVVAGYNDVLNCGLDSVPLGLDDSLDLLERAKETAAHKMKEDARALMDTVLAAHPHNQVNSVAFAALPVPPCISWVDRSNTEVARGQNAVRGQKISLLNIHNENIRVLNAECKERTGVDTVRAPSFRSWGLKKRLNAEVGPGGPYAHRFAHFREGRPEHMLHFSPYMKLKMGRAVGRYFKALYGLAESVGDSKAEAVALKAALKSLPQNRRPEESRNAREIFWDPGFDRCNPRDF